MSKELEKQGLRTEIGAKLSGLDEAFCLEHSLRIVDQLSARMSEFDRDVPLVVLGWIPSFLAEPQIELFLDNRLSKGDVYAPVMRDKDCMTFIKLMPDWQAHLTKGVLRNLEPVYERRLELRLDTSQQVAILLPGLAFDRAGNRLGRGKGNYDRFLANQRLSSWIRIGVCWSFQIVDEVPVDEHDLKVDYICTENEWIKIERAL